MPMRGLADKCVIVTGGGGGIGSALCERFADERCSVAVFDINEAAAERVAADIGERGGSARAYPVNIADYDGVAQAVDAVAADLGPVDVLVNNAGWDKFLNFLDTDPDLWERVIDVNLRGMLNMHHVVLPGMVEREGGKVINISSDAARVGSSTQAVYAACKGGVISFTKTVARELARVGVCLNVVCPGPTETPLLEGMLQHGTDGEKIYAALKRAIPMKRLGQPADMPGVVAFLASDDADYITGQVISVSGGLTMAG